MNRKETTPPDWYLPEFEPKTLKYINPRIPFLISVTSLLLSLVSLTISVRRYRAMHDTRTDATEARKDSAEIRTIIVPHFIPIRF